MGWVIQQSAHQRLHPRVPEIIIQVRIIQHWDRWDYLRAVLEHERPKNIKNRT